MKIQQQGQQKLSLIAKQYYFFHQSFFSQMVSWTSRPRRTTVQAPTKPPPASPLQLGSKGKSTGLVKLTSVSGEEVKDVGERAHLSVDQ